jgi:hypothetical protein
MTSKKVSLICIFSFLIFSINITVAVSQEYVTSGLVAFWTLDSANIDGDTVKDVSGNGNDAKIMGDLNSVKGQVDECLEFDGGAGNYVELPDMGEFNQVSVECWALETQFSGIQGIVSTWQWVAGKVHFKFESNEIQVDKNGAGKIRSAAQAGTWYHIIYTTDTPTALKLYVNGELAAEGPGGAEPENWHERRIGSEHDGRFLNGMIDEVRIYNRVLSADEVKRNFLVVSNELTAVEAALKLTTSWGRIKSAQ